MKIIDWNLIEKICKENKCNFVLGLDAQTWRKNEKYWVHFTVIDIMTCGSTSYEALKRAIDKMESDN